MDSLYRDNILDHYKNPRNFGKLINYDVSFDEANVSCGDKIGFQIKLTDKTIKDIRFFGRGCAISMACASMITEEVKGKNIKNILKIGKNEVIKMLGIVPSISRIKCALLPLEVLHKALLLAKKV